MSNRDYPIFVPRLLAHEGRQAEPRPLDTYLDAAMVVVLGDPGAGKSELFKHTAVKEGGLLLSVRELLRQPLDGPAAQPLYLDALDEMRSRDVDGHGVLDDVIRTLHRLGRSKVRLSCRATDWFGRLDSSQLREVSADGEIRVLHLQPLTDEDISTIARAQGADPRLLLAQAEDHGVVEWLRNPQDLLLLIEGLGGGPWPDSRVQLFARACESLAKDPNPSHARSTRARNQSDLRGFAALAGLDLLWARQPEGVLQLPPPTLARAVINHLACGSIPNRGAEPPWIIAVLNAYPELTEQALWRFWEPALKQRRDHVAGLENLKGWEVGRSLSIRLLEAFPRSHSGVLRELIFASVAHGHGARVLELVRVQMARPQGLRTEQYLTWLGTGFLLAPVEYTDKILAHAPRPVRPDAEMKRASFLRDFLRSAWMSLGDLIVPLSVESLEALILACTRAYPHLPIFQDGYGPHDIADVPLWVRHLIDRLGGKVEEEAREALLRLHEHSDMAPWRDYIGHTLENQVKLRREVGFRQPTFAEVIKALGGGPPANVADLCAVLLDHLEEVADDIRNGRTDGYKAYWNLDRHQKPTGPLPEEACRDRLMDRLVPRLGTLGVSVEREASHAESKRADLRVSYGNAAVPVECKRHYHCELWSGIAGQLPRYTRDPQCAEYGIYLVFWFGLDDSKFPATPPAGVAVPSSAHELELTLQELVPDEQRNQTVIKVIDVSRPQPETHQKQRRSGDHRGRKERPGHQRVSVTADPASGAPA